LVGVSGGTTASFAYDAFARRQKKTIGAAVTQFLYDGINPVQELDGSVPPNVTANLLAGLGIDEYFQRTDSNGARSFLTDSLGTTLALTDGTGTIQTQYSYDPFGNVTAAGQSSTNSYQFTGRENDGTGVRFYRARYYSPSIQRFVSQDPIGFAGGDVNLYNYAFGNPLSFRDESGEGPIAALLVGAGCYGYLAYNHFSNMSQLNRLGRERDQTLQQKKDLMRQRDECDDPVRRFEIDQQIQQLEQRYLNLVSQYLVAHALDSFTDEMEFAGCGLATLTALGL
jgi:RHS repeat-associated protein